MKKTLILIHGSKEHSGRYKEFISFLEEKNINVVTGDLASHGEFLIKNNHNFTFDEVLDSVLLMIDKAIKDFPENELYIMGHSFGSIIVKYIVYKNIRKFNGVILSGTNNPSKFLTNLGVFLTGLGNQDKVSRFFEFSVFGVFKIKSKIKTGNKNWLSSDIDNFYMYLEDDLCNKDFTKKSINAMLKLIKESSSESTLLNFKDKNIKQMIIYGGNDPVPNFGKEIKRMIKIQNKYNINNHYVLEYKKSKHEILFDIEKENVFKDILDFINNK